MIPIKDHSKTNIFPFITYLLIGINVFSFLTMISMPINEFDLFIQTYALVPKNIIKGDQLYTLLTAMFLHGGFGHIISNMLFLNIFGDNLEEFFGHFKYLIFYLATGLAASVTQILINPTSTIPVLGASGAIAGLMGGYLILRS